MTLFRKFLISIILLVSVPVTHLYAQVEAFGTRDMLTKLRLDNSIKGIGDVMYTEIKGNPFILENFSSGKVNMMNGEVFNIDLRYDIYADEMQFKIKGNIYGISYTDSIEYIWLDNIKFIYSKYCNSYKQSYNEDESYFIVLVDASYSLLKKKNIRIEDPVPPKIYQEAKPAKFVHRKDSYYIITSGKSALLINNIKSIAAYIEGDGDYLKRMMKKERLSIAKEADLIRLVQIINGSE